MTDDTIIRKDTAEADALLLFHQRVHGLEALGFADCRRYIEAMDVKLGPVGIPALLEAYGASYLTILGSSRTRPSPKQWTMARGMLGRDPSLRTTIGYYAETMRLLDDVFAYCLEAKIHGDAENAANVFAALETRFVKSFTMLHMGMDEKSSSAVFAETMRIAQDAIEQAQHPLEHIKLDAVSGRTYWVQRQVPDHSGMQQAAMRRYFDRLLDMPQFRRPVEALAGRLEHESRITVDTRFRDTVKPLIVAACPYAEAMLYPSDERGKRTLTRSPIHRSTLAKLERALAPVEARYEGKERADIPGMRIPSGPVPAIAGHADKVARMMGIGEAIFNAVATGTSLSKEEHRGLPSPAQRIAADMVSATLAPSQEKALAFVADAAKIAKEELRNRGRSSLTGRS